MTNDTPTPRTDAEEIDLSTRVATEGLFPNRRKVVKYVPSRLARELERENATLRGHIAAISDAVESVQDWSGTRVGDAIDAARKDAL